MVTREEAEAAIHEFYGFSTEDGWVRRVVLDELILIPLAEAASTTLSLYNLFLFEKWCWACKFSTIDTHPDGRCVTSRPTYGYVVMPLAQPLVIE